MEEHQDSSRQSRSPNQVHTVEAPEIHPLRRRVAVMVIQAQVEDYASARITLGIQLRAVSRAIHSQMYALALVILPLEKIQGISNQPKKNILAGGSKPGDNGVVTLGESKDISKVSFVFSCAHFVPFVSTQQLLCST